MKLPPFLFHGTSSKYLAQILEQGLKPLHVTGRLPMTCLADDVVVARHHAFHMAEWEEAEEVVFRIPTGRFEVGLFTLEDKFVNLGPSAGRGVYAKALMSDAWLSAPWTWRSMLAIGGAVGYLGTVRVHGSDVMRPHARTATPDLCPGFGRSLVRAALDLPSSMD